MPRLVSLKTRLKLVRLFLPELRRTLAPPRASTSLPPTLPQRLLQPQKQHLPVDKLDAMDTSKLLGFRREGAGRRLARALAQSRLALLQQRERKAACP